MSLEKLSMHRSDMLFNDKLSFDKILLSIKALTKEIVPSSPSRLFSKFSIFKLLHIEYHKLLRIFHGDDIIYIFHALNIEFISAQIYFL